MIINLLFLFIQSASALGPTTATRDACKGLIAERICHTEEEPNILITGRDPYKYFTDLKTFKCTSKGRAYASKLEAVYDTLPKLAKKMFCQIKQIHIAPLSMVGGFTHFNLNLSRTTKVQNKRRIPIDGFYLLLDETSRFLASETCSKAETRRYLAAFWGEPNVAGTLNYALQPDSGDCVLRHTLIHEIGHMLDIANGVLQNQLGFYKHEEPFFKLSWELNNGRAELLDKNFMEDTLGISSSMTQKNYVTVMENFYNSSFASYYAASSPREDFAEAFAYLFYNSVGIFNFDGTKYDFAGRRDFNEKLKLVEELVNSPKLNYDPKILTPSILIPIGIE